MNFENVNVELHVFIMSFILIKFQENQRSIILSRKKERIYAYFDVREEENLRIGFSLRLHKRNYNKT